MNDAQKSRTVWLVGGLHALTHVYQVALIPLYLLIQADFHLKSKGEATLLVTLMNLAYYVPSYPMGMLADKLSRKKLLAIGLLINGAAFVGLAMAPNYAVAIVAVMLAGFGGSFFHPAATALIAGLFPLNPGRALGLTGIGASVGFCFAPLYSGWRAQAGSWRTPVFELGLMGVAVAVVFWILGHEEQARAGSAREMPEDRLFPTPVIWFLFIVAAFAFCARDFTGNGVSTMGSLYLQQARGYNTWQTGMALSCIFAASAISNPLFGHLSDRGRMGWAGAVLTVAAILVAAFPHIPPAGIIPAFLVYGFFFMASYPIVEAALMESVPAGVRGRVFGLWITIGGLVGNLAHWLSGSWVESIGA